MMTFSSLMKKKRQKRNRKNKRNKKKRKGKKVKVRIKNQKKKTYNHKVESRTKQWKNNFNLYDIFEKIDNIEIQAYVFFVKSALLFR